MSNRGIRGDSGQGPTAISEKSDDGFERVSDKSFPQTNSTNTRGRRPGRTHARVIERQPWHSILLLLTFIHLKPRITVFGVGGAGGNAVNNMITAGLQGVDFVVANTDAQALTMSKAQRIVHGGRSG